MERQQKIDRAVEIAGAAMLRDDNCARSVLIGLQTISDEIPDEMITAAFSLAGGTGAASGSCGAYCGGLLGVGAEFNHPVEDELENKALQMEGVKKFSEYRDRFLGEYGTIQCPGIQEQLFGRSWDFTDPEEGGEFLTMEGHTEKCAEVVAAATRIAAEMILADEEA